MARSPFVADTSGFFGGVGSIISEKINSKLAEKALAEGGDDAALGRLSSRDPNQANQIGSILQNRQETQAQQMGQSDEFKRRVAKSFAAASTPEERKSVLQSVIPSLQGRPGMEPLIADIQDDINRIDSDPDSVMQEYAGANVIFDTMDQLKVGARKIFNDGTIIQSTQAGPRVFSADGRQLQGEEAQSQMRKALDNEIALAGAKSQAAGKGGVMGKREGGIVDLETDIAESTETAKLTARDKDEQKKKMRQNARDKRVFDSSIASYRKALGAAAAGPIASQLTSLSSNARIADNARSILFPAIKSMVRAPGEGVFTDADAKAVEAMLPDRSMPRAAQAAVIDNIVGFVEARLGGDLETPATQLLGSPSGGGQPVSVGRFTVEEVN